MQNILKKYLSILEIELEDLIGYMQDLKEIGVKRHNAGDITNYVYKENEAIFNNEANAFNAFKHIAQEVNTENFKDIDELIGYLKNEFQKTRKKAGYARAALLFVEQKLEKVQKFVCVK